MTNKQFMHFFNGFEKAIKEQKEERHSNSNANSLMYLVLKYNTPKTT